MTALLVAVMFELAGTNVATTAPPMPTPPPFVDLTDSRVATYKHASRALLTEPENTHLYNLRAIASHDLGQYVKAAQDFDRAIEIHPERMLYYNRGLLYAITGDDKNAKKFFEMAMQNDTTLSARFQESINYYDRVISRANAISQSALAYYHRGVVYMQLFDYEKAIADFVAALNLDMNLTLARKRLNDARQKLADEMAMFETADEEQVERFFWSYGKN